MHLLLRQSERDDGWFWSSMTFLLYARLELDAEEQHLFEKYGLHDVVIYDSNQRTQHAHTAHEKYQASIDASDSVPLFPALNEIHTALGNFFASVWYLGSGATHEVISALSLRISIQSLIDGQHVESQSLDEILTVGNSICASAEHLANYFTVAVTFDGREQLHEY